MSSPRGWAGPSLLAMILFEKFGQHQPLNRQAERYAREGVPLSLSTLADQVGACCAVLAPLLRRVEAHVFAAERLHGDDTTVPVLAKGKTDTGRCWVYVRDDRPFGGPAPPAAMFYYSRDRGGEHPAGASGRLCRASSRPTPMAATTSCTRPTASRGRSSRRRAGRMPAGRSSSLADIAANARRKAQGKTPALISPLALEAVRRIDALFDIERAINGQSAERAPRGAAGTERAAGRRSRTLAARGAAQAVARQRSRQGDGLHAQALAGLHPLPRRRPHLPDRTTPPSARCAASPSAENRGCSPAPIAAASAPPRCTA